MAKPSPSPNSNPNPNPCPNPDQAARMSSCDSSIFIFATTAAARRWPVTPQKEAALRAAMSHTIPRNFKRASQASKALQHERKKQRKR